MSWSFNIGSIAGTQVRIHVTFVLFLAWIFAASYAAGGADAAWSATLFLVLLFLCVLAHEFGHIFTARAFGVKTPDVTLLPIGGVARLESIPEKPREEFLIAIAGPLVNVVIAIVLFAFTGANMKYGAVASMDDMKDPADRQARHGQSVSRAVQHDPGLPDGRRARAARAARNEAWLRARDRNRGLDRTGHGIPARLYRAVLQSAADLHRDLRLSRGVLGSAYGRLARGLARRAGFGRDHDADRLAHAGGAYRRGGADACSPPARTNSP